MSETSEAHGEETDENGKVIVQDSSTKEDKTVNDASGIDTKGKDQHPENLKNEEQTNDKPSVDSDGSTESDPQNKMNPAVDNPDKKKVSQGSEEAPQVAQNADDSTQKQVVQTEQSTLARKEENVEGNVPETVSKVTESAKDNQGSARQEQGAMKPSETLKSTDRTIYKESEAKPIWEEKKQSDTRFASANDSLKNMNAEDYLPPRNNDRGDSNGE